MLWKGHEVPLLHLYYLYKRNPSQYQGQFKGSLFCPKDTERISIISTST